LRSLLPAVQPALAELRAHADPQVRALALELLARVGASARQHFALAAALDDGDERVQSAALDALGDGSAELSADARARLAALASADPRWWMRRRAVAALARALGAAARPAIERALLEDTYAYVREQAATSLGELRSDAAVSALARASQNDAEPRVRVAAARALARIGSVAAARALERVDAGTRAAARGTAGEN
jgi:hypothetical protein